MTFKFTKSGLSSDRIGVRSLALLIVASGTAVHVVPSCAGRGTGPTYSEIETSLRSTCANCHDAAGFGALLDQIQAVPDDRFSEEAFPSDHFPSGLNTQSVADLVKAAEPPKDAKFDPNMAQRKAWILHELHELEGLLAEGTPPDYTSQATFDRFATFGEAGAYEGCEIGEKLDLGHKNDVEGMPPRWAAKLFETLGKGYAPITPEQRQRLRDYVDALLPGGLKACEAGGSSGSAS